jgi:hypothetical protein
MSSKNAPQAGTWSLEFWDAKRAAAQLELVGKNRPLNGSRVRRYAGHLQNGTFLLTHQGIAIAPNGDLRDGRHRLSAIVQSGVGAWLWTYRGIDENCMLHIDTMQPRSATQNINISGTEIDRNEVAIIRVILADRTANPNWLTEEDIIAGHKTYGTSIAEVRMLFSKSHASMRHACIVTAAVKAWEKFPDRRDDVSRFIEILGSGVIRSEDEVAAIKFRDWAMSHPEVMHGGRAERVGVYLKSAFAIMAFLEGRIITKILTPNDDPIKLQQ